LRQIEVDASCEATPSVAFGDISPSRREIVRFAASAIFNDERKDRVSLLWECHPADVSG
jgi:hypothetical protein